MPIKPVTLIGWMHEYGVSVIFMALVTILLFAYFWKVINNRPEYLKVLDGLRQSFEQLLAKYHTIEVTVAKIETILNGDFRNRGGRNG